MRKTALNLCCILVARSGEKGQMERLFNNSLVIADISFCKYF